MSQITRTVPDTTHETPASVNTGNAVQSRTQSAQIVRDTSEIRITTSLRTKSCDPLCPCQCHVRTRYRTPSWLSTVVGTLFYESSHTPTVTERPCNFIHCARSQRSSNVHMTYYFPVWLFRSALVYATWSNLSGTNSSWTVGMPREISNNHIWYDIVNKSNILEAKRMLSERSITPYDVASDGESILTVSVQSKKYAETVPRLTQT